MLGQEEQTGTTLDNQDRLYKETNSEKVFNFPNLHTGLRGN